MNTPQALQRTIDSWAGVESRLFFSASASRRSRASRLVWWTETKR